VLAPTDFAPRRYGIIPRYFDVAFYISALAVCMAFLAGSVFGLTDRRMDMDWD